LSSAKNVGFGGIPQRDKTQFCNYAPPQAAGDRFSTVYKQYIVLYFL